MSKKVTRKPAEPEQGYKGEHLEGSRKSKVHAAYDEHGVETALTLGLKLKLKPSTLRTWTSAWAREDAKAKPAPKAKPKAKSKPSKAVPAEAVNVNGGAAVATN